MLWELSYLTVQLDLTLLSIGINSQKSDWGPEAAAAIDKTRQYSEQD